MRTLRFLFGLSEPVSRRSYVLWGVGLMVLKFALEFALVRATTGHLLTPFEFFVPLLSVRTFADEMPVEALIAGAVGSLPFFWVCLSLSVRRALDAGEGATWGLVVLVPGVNYAVFAYLAVAASQPRSLEVVEPRGASRVSPRIRSALLGLGFGTLLTLGMTFLAAVVLGAYGATLFFATPVILGAVTAWVFNSDEQRGGWATAGVVTLAVLLAALVLLLIALEGLVCILMVLPLALPAALLGGVAGRFVARSSQGRSTSAFVLPLVALPAGAVVDAKWPRELPLREVVSTVEIDAPPERVWSNVLGFSELPPPHEVVLLAGVAYPVRARIEGTGVGAVRHCEFSTGAFVEPITHFEPPRRLAFDVTSQPAPLDELSPYSRLHPPHLDGYFRSRRGEFRLVALPVGRTRLEGSTWYELDLEPLPYWMLWSDSLIHTIHGRVLEHIRTLSERRAGE